MKPLSIYGYSDYRLFLREWYEQKLNKNSNYSHRTMAREMGFPSPNYIKMVMDGQRNLGARGVRRLVEGLGLREREREFFTLLVSFTQAKAPKDKKAILDQMSRFRPAAQSRELSPAEYRYYNEWHHCVVRELVAREPVPRHKGQPDFERIAESIKPAITAAQVKKSVELLVELGLLIPGENGSYRQSSRALSTDKEVTSLGIRQYHERMIDLGKLSMEITPGKEREVSSVTLCVSKDCRDRIKQRIQEFESEILNMAQNDTHAHQVHQLNFQFFPLTQEPKDKREKS